MSESSLFPAGATPLWDAYVRERDSMVTRLALPGHKRATHLAGDAVSVDTPVWLTGDLQVPSLGSVAVAESAAARLWGADVARFSVNGSSAVNQATMMALSTPGADVVVSRTLHKSLLWGLVYSGALPVWVRPDFDPVSGLPVGVSAGAVRARLSQHSSASGVFVGDPSYARTVGGVREIADVTRDAGVPLVVDAAWAGHFGFHSDLPAHALMQGADVMVVSVHKALTGFSQSALLLANTGMVDASRLSACVDATQTTSPSAAIMASIDAARALLQFRGEVLLGTVLEAVAEVRQPLMDTFPGLCLEHLPVEPLSLPLWMPAIGVDGLLVAERLQARGFVLEMVSRDLLIPHFTLADEPRVVREFGVALMQVLEDVSGSSGRVRSSSRPGVNAWQVDPVVAMTPREAFFAPGERVDVSAAVGRVCKELVAPYPPGVPALAPGERVTREALDVIEEAQRGGVTIAYASDPSLSSLEVVA